MSAHIRKQFFFLNETSIVYCNVGGQFSLDGASGRRQMSVSIQAFVVACPWGPDGIRIPPEPQPLRATRVHSLCSFLKGGPYSPPILFLFSFSLSLSTSLSFSLLPPLSLLSPLPVNLLCEPCCMVFFSLLE